MTERRPERPDARRPRELRLFIACPLPDETKLALAAVQSELLRLGANHLRWVRPESIHITLKFLGGVLESRVDEITNALAAAVEPFELRLRPTKLGGFGGTRMRVVWVGLEGDVDALGGLAASVEESLAPLGFPRERRPFAPHLTLARVGDGLSPAERRELASIIGEYRFAALGPMVVTEVLLMQSTLGPGGSVYRQLASFPRPSGAAPLDGLDRPS